MSDSHLLHSHQGSVFLRILASKVLSLLYLAMCGRPGIKYQRTVAATASFLTWRCQTVPGSWDPTWTSPLSAVKVHLEGEKGEGKPECESERCRLVVRAEWAFQLILVFCLTPLHSIFYHHWETSRLCALRITDSGHPWKWSEQAFTRQCA